MHICKKKVSLAVDGKYFPLLFGLCLKPTKDKDKKARVGR